MLRGKKEKKRKRVGKWECSGLNMVEERRKKEKSVATWVDEKKRGEKKKKKKKKKKQSCVLDQSAKRQNSMLKLKLLSIFIIIFLQYFHNKS